MQEQGYTVAELCGALGLLPSGYYAARGRAPSPRTRENTRIAQRVRMLHSERFTRSYGSPRATRAVNTQGIRCSENRVARIMRNQGLRALGKRPFRPRTTTTDQEANFHSDRGCQHTNSIVRGQLAAGDISQSMSAKGNCYYNATNESFFASLKAEAFPRDGTFESRGLARLAVFEYIEGFYNTRRLHSSIDYRSPNMFLEQYNNTTNNRKRPLN